MIFNDCSIRLQHKTEKGAGGQADFNKSLRPSMLLCYPYFIVTLKKSMWPKNVTLMEKISKKKKKDLDFLSGF